MYLIQNAIRNLFRNRGRTIILALITFLIICAAAVSFLINGATKSIISSYRTQFGNQVTIGSDSAGDSAAGPAVADYLEYGKSDLLQNTEFSMTAYGRLDGAKALDEETPDGDANTILSATSRSDWGSDFHKGLRSISQGSVPEGKNECLISEEFAELNHLTVGSTVTITPSDSSKSGSVTLSVSGIYSDNSVTGRNGQAGDPLYNRNNEIITSVETASAIDFLVNSVGMQFTATYYLKNPDLLEDFKTELHEKGLPASFSVTANEKEYEKIVGPVENLAKISNLFLVVVLVLGAAVLILVSIMSMRERKYEVGVLRAMGMKKAKVVLSMLVETLTVTAICLIIGLGAGALAAQPVANALMQQTAQSEQAGDDAEQQRVSVDIHMTPSVAGEISLIALLLAGISSAAGVVYITRFEPRKILSERN